MNEALNDPSPATSNDQLLILEYADWQHWSMLTGNTGVCQLQHWSMPTDNTGVCQLATLEYASWQH